MEEELQAVSNCFWANQGASYPNYGTTKQRRLQELNYVMSRLKTFDSVETLIDLGCGTGSTVTILQELTDISTFYCFDLSPAMLSTIDTRSLRGASVKTSVLDVSNLSTEFSFPEADLVLCFGLFQCLSDECVIDILRRLPGNTLLARDACYLPHEGRKDINTFSAQLKAQYSCRYRTLDEYMRLCSNGGWCVKDVRRSFSDDIESKFGTKQWFLHLERE